MNKNSRLELGTLENWLWEAACVIRALGIAGKLTGDENHKLVRSYLDRYPSLGEFLQRQDVAIISVLVIDYILARFDRAERIRINDIS